MNLANSSSPSLGSLSASSITIRQPFQLSGDGQTSGGIFVYQDSYGDSSYLLAHLNIGVLPILRDQQMGSGGN